ncbi:hypothetical protein TSAR_001816 [Trichomalopsis sarcophagae]|uniref:ZP domain-containing protein n=1 Tax=Trichomalopsis sarcophagae TaxID=543379 RepID=A0A232FMZ8_9HYME|nr:hypothetical protein TSAR_001816 [Trichomalopsis sarcophagae]
MEPAAVMLLLSCCLAAIAQAWPMDPLPRLHIKHPVIELSRIDEIIHDNKVRVENTMCVAIGHSKTTFRQRFNKIIFVYVTHSIFQSESVICGYENSSARSASTSQREDPEDYRASDLVIKIRPTETKEKGNWDNYEFSTPSTCQALLPVLRLKPAGRVLRRLFLTCERCSQSCGYGKWRTKLQHS